MFMASVRSAARSAVLLMLVLGLGCFTAFAQFSSGIEGTARDQSGAAIAGAKVTATDIRLGVEKTTTTNQDGYFRIDSIAASTYSIQIQMAGFKTYSQKDLAIQVGEIRTIAPVLEIGAVSTDVTVSADQTTINTVSATTGAVIAEETVQETPLPGQNVYGLSALTPGMTGSAVTSGDNYTNEYAININAAGLRQEQNGFEIDGAYTNTPSRGGGTSISPNPEIVQSMDIRTNDFDAQKGRNGGATVDVFTNSGSNDFHGTFDYYFTNNDLLGLNHFETSVPTFQRNEMGATIGGPIIKNKLFIFGAIDVLRSSTTSAGQYTVETSDFDTWVSTNLPNTVGAQVLKMAPPQVFPTSGFQTAAQVEAANQGVATVPANLPSTLNVVGVSNISFSVPKNGYQWDVRGDYYIGNSDRVYVTSIRTYDTSEGATPRTALNIPQANSSDFVNVDWTHTFSPRLLNEGGANIIRPYGADLPTASEQIPYINVNGLQGFSNWGPGNFTQSTLGWRDVMTATIKTHTLKFGFDEFNIREADTQSGAFDRPTYNFNNILDLVQDAALSESATPVNLETHIEAPYQRRYRALYTGAYVQDDWKLMRNLTLNLGVRYDVMTNFFSIESPSLTNFTLASGSSFDGSIAGGKAGFTNTPHVLDHSPWGINPRVGFSWDVFGKGKTAVRGGFGLFSDQPPYIHITDITAGNLPNFFTPSLNRQSGTTPTFALCSAPTGFSEDCPIVPTNNVVLNSSGGIVGQRAGLGGYSPNYKLTQVEDWTLSVQQELGNNLVAEINYSGSAAHHLPVFNQDLNRFDGDLIQNKGTLTRLNPNFGDINYATSNANSAGHYGSALVQRRVSHGLAFRGIYTIGKALDTDSTSGSLDGGEATQFLDSIIENGNLKFQRGRSDFSIHQQFSADGTWMVPNHYPSLWERSVLGGWQFGGVWIMQTGLPLSVYNGASFSPVFDASGNVIGNTGGDYNADGSDYDVPNTPSFGNHLNGEGKKNYLNGIFTKADFPTPALGKQGNLGRNTFDQPGYNNVDFTFEKFFNVPWFFSEKMKIEAKGEVFNLFNRSNLISVDGNMADGTFGHATNQLPARSLQLHLRASF
jgi:hypothetical protein